MNHKPLPVTRLPDQKPAQALPLPQNTNGQEMFSVDEISRAAYYIYLNQGSQQGYDVQHWEEAQRQLRDKQKISRDHMVL